MTMCPAVNSQLFERSHQASSTSQHQTKQQKDSDSKNGSAHPREHQINAKQS